MKRRGAFPFSVTVFCPRAVGKRLAGTGEECRKGILNLMVREDTAAAAEQGAIEEVCLQFGVFPEDITEVVATVISPERAASLITILTDTDELDPVSGGVPPPGGAPATAVLHS